ncbi:MAG: hypothetical protein IJ091_11265 [Oscillospiraceae bacterium]|nr:hypothetical protein [Oscillospiraceae bacterium]MBQ8996378.1 hypothetical protein [Oscillospiraceae bacterium]
MQVTDINESRDTLQLDNYPLSEVKIDLNAAIKEALDTMISKQATAGTLSLKIDFTLLNVWNPKTQQSTLGLEYDYETTISVTSKSKNKGSFSNPDLALIMNESGEYELENISDQISMF